MLVENDKTLPLITLMTLIYADQKLEKRDAKISWHSDADDCINKS